MLLTWTLTPLRLKNRSFGRASAQSAGLRAHVISCRPLSASCRTQLFLYLKTCGREELGTMNLWAGVDAPAPV